MGRRRPKRIVRRADARAIRTVSSKVSPPWYANAAFFGNLFVFAVLAYAAVLARYFPGFYFRSVTEDAYLEWMTFWAFIIAAGAFFAAAFYQHQTAVSRIPWFHTGVGLFCLVVAMEEISWGQRLFGYRPPAYFLERNSHMEFNFHNILESSLRQRAFLVLIGGYGVLLPLVAGMSVFRELLEKLSIVGPTLWLLPSFLASCVLYYWYPWNFSGELVELMLGVGFLSAGLEHVQRYRQGWGTASGWRFLVRYASLFSVVVCLGLLSSAWVRRERRADQSDVDIARRETRALMDDLLAAAAQKGVLATTVCGDHARMRDFVEVSQLRELHDGHFAVLKQRGGQVSDARYFLDPWNSSYWIWHDSCDEGAHTVFIYSLGPNRVLESTVDGPMGDDVGERIVIDRPLWELLSQRLWNGGTRRP